MENQPCLEALHGEHKLRSAGHCTPAAVVDMWPVGSGNGAIKVRRAVSSCPRHGGDCSAGCGHHRRLAAACAPTGRATACGSPAMGTARAVQGTGTAAATALRVRPPPMGQQRETDWAAVQAPPPYQSRPPHQVLLLLRPYRGSCVAQPRHAPPVDEALVSGRACPLCFANPVVLNAGTGCWSRDAQGTSLQHAWRAWAEAL